MLMSEVLVHFPGRTRAGLVARANAIGARRGHKRSHPGKVVSPHITRNGVVGKACVECLEWKPLENFGRHHTCAGGRRNICTTCESRRAYLNNPEACIARVRRYQNQHPQKVLAQRRNSRARKQSPESIGISLQEYEAIFDIWGGCCAYCGDPATTIDHVEPLSRGGLHVLSNIVPCCHPCNAGKRDRNPTDWPKGPSSFRGRRVMRGS